MLVDTGHAEMVQASIFQEFLHQRVTFAVDDLQNGFSGSFKKRRPFI